MVVRSKFSLPSTHRSLYEARTKALHLARVQTNALFGFISLPSFGCKRSLGFGVVGWIALQVDLLYFQGSGSEVFRLFFFGMHSFCNYGIALDKEQEQMVVGIFGACVCQTRAAETQSTAMTLLEN